MKEHDILFLSPGFRLVAACSLRNNWPRGSTGKHINHVKVQSGRGLNAEAQKFQSVEKKSRRRLCSSVTWGRGHQIKSLRAVIHPGFTSYQAVPHQGNGDPSKTGSLTWRKSGGGNTSCVTSSMTLNRLKEFKLFASRMRGCSETWFLCWKTHRCQHFTHSRKTWRGFPLTVLPTWIKSSFKCSLNWLKDLDQFFSASFSSSVIDRQTSEVPVPIKSTTPSPRKPSRLRSNSIRSSSRPARGRHFPKSPGKISLDRT